MRDNCWARVMRWRVTNCSGVMPVDDTNEIVGVAAAYSLARLAATNAAPALFAKLMERLQSPPTTSEEMSPHVRAIVQDTRGEDEEFFRSRFLSAPGCRCVLKLDQQDRVSTVLKAEPPWSPTGLTLHGEDLYWRPFCQFTLTLHKMLMSPHLSSSPRELHQPCLHRRGERAG